MTISLSRAQEGLLWEEAVCLDCGELFEGDATLGKMIWPAVCSECGGRDVYQCSLIVAIVAKVEEEAT